MLYSPPNPSLCKKYFFYCLNILIINILIIKWETLELRAEIVLSNRKKKKKSSLKASILEPWTHILILTSVSLVLNIKMFIVILHKWKVWSWTIIFFSFQLATYYHEVYRSKLVTRVGSLSPLQGIFPSQGLNPGLLHYRQILYQLSHQGSP